MSRATAKEALTLIHGTSTSAIKLRRLIMHMDKSLQISITDKEINEHISAQFRKSVAKTSARASTNDRKVLSKARVITSEDVERLREPRDTVDAVKVAKAMARYIKKQKRVRGLQFRRLREERAERKSLY